MQMEVADFAPSATTWRTGRSIHIIFDSGPFVALCEKRCHPQSQKYIMYCTAVRRGPNHGHR